MQHLLEHGIEFLTHVPRVDAHPHRRERELLGGRDEQFLDIRPHVGQRRFHPGLRLLRAAAERHNPAGRVVAVVGELLDALHRDRGEDRVRDVRSRSNSARRQSTTPAVA